jgi:hypothetical protein
MLAGMSVLAVGKIASHQKRALLVAGILSLGQPWEVPLLNLWLVLL